MGDNGNLTKEVHAMPTIREIYNEVFEIPQGKKRNNFVKYFAYKFDEKDFKKKIDMLMDNYLKFTKGSEVFDSIIYANAVEETVKKTSSNKDAFIAAYKAFDSFLEKNYKITVAINYPSIPVSNTFERLMFIAKYLQDDNNKVSDLEEELWVSDKTIQTDLKKLKGDDPIQVCGKSFVIHEMERKSGSVKFESTAHPFFLTCNLTQVIVTLEGLKQMAERPEYRGYALPLARNIWMQLSEYGKQRIKTVCEKLLHVDFEWYQSLETDDNEFSYKTERECSKEGDNVLMDCLKNGDKRSCCIEYKDESGTRFIENVKLIDYDGNWNVEVNGEKITLEHDKILKSSYNKENMF